MKEIDIEYLPIIKSDGWNNSSFIPTGLVLHSTALPNVNAYGIQKYFNQPNLGASIHGCVDDEHIVQCLPWNKRAGHVGSGSKGSFNYTHLGIEMCEPKGLIYNSNSSAIIKYNPPPDYFKKVWNNTVNLFAYLCNQFNLDPLKKGVIVSHAEACALGYGSNHADTAHWFKWENKTMDDFRQDVYKILQEFKEEDDDTLTYEQFKEYMDRYLNEHEITEPSSWAKESCELAIKKGILKGNGKGAFNFQKPLTRESYIELQYRQGLL